MAYEGYESWTPEFQEIWENLPADYQHMSRDQYDWAQYLFEEAFQLKTEDKMYEDQISEARTEFFRVMGPIVEDLFDWQAWREAMDY